MIGLRGVTPSADDEAPTEALHCCVTLTQWPEGVRSGGRGRLRLHDSTVPLLGGPSGAGGQWRPRGAAGVSHDPRGPDPAGDSVARRVQTTECERVDVWMAVCGEHRRGPT